VENKEVLEKSFQWFMDNASELSKKHPEKFIAIKDCKVLAAYDTFEEALVETEKNGHKRGTFIIQQACADPSAFTAIYFNNYVRMV